MRKRQRRQRKRQNHRSRLRPDHPQMPVVPVADVPADRSQHQNRNLVRKSENAQQRRRIRKLIYEPKLRGRLHPCPDQRDHLPRNKQLEISMSQGAKPRGHEQVAPLVVECTKQELITMTCGRKTVNETKQRDKTKLYRCSKVFAITCRGPTLLRPVRISTT